MTDDTRTRILYFRRGSLSYYFFFFSPGQSPIDNINVGLRRPALSPYFYYPHSTALTRYFVISALGRLVVPKPPFSPFFPRTVVRRARRRPSVKFTAPQLARRNIFESHFALLLLPPPLAAELRRPVGRPVQRAHTHTHTIRTAGTGSKG